MVEDVFMGEEGFGFLKMGKRNGFLLIVVIVIVDLYYGKLGFLGIIMSLVSVGGG